jgi:sugar lactone lactonase YvrE
MNLEKLKALCVTLVVLLAYSCKTAESNIQQAAPQVPTIKLLSETENLSHAESVAYDQKRDLLYVSVQGEQEPGDGSIATLKTDGSIQNASFATGLNNPKGIAVKDNKLYVSDATELIEIDINSGSILNRYSSGDEQFLNDVAIDNQGNVYVSDMRTSSIYKLDTKGTFGKWMSTPELENPNGLLVVNDILYVAAWGLPDTNDPQAIPQGRFLKVNLQTQFVEKITARPQGNLDGLQVYDEDHFLLSDWRKGLIFKVSKSGEMSLFLTSEISVGDILYIQDQKLLALPLNRQNKVQIYQVNE